jgi:hypothetical protein
MFAKSRFQHAQQAGLASRLFLQHFNERHSTGQNLVEIQTIDTDDIGLAPAVERFQPVLREAWMLTNGPRVQVGSAIVRKYRRKMREGHSIIRLVKNQQQENSERTGLPLGTERHVRQDPTV